MRQNPGTGQAAGCRTVRLRQPGSFGAVAWFHRDVTQVADAEPVDPLDRAQGAGPGAP